MGFDGLFFGRLDYADKDKRKFEKTMEMVWKASQSLYQSSWLFTGALFNGYGPPEGFCFDDECQDEPFMDDPRVGFMKENFRKGISFLNKFAIIGCGFKIMCICA
jgi:lysosomal alpha-mannosidase